MTLKITSLVALRLVVLAVAVSLVEVFPTVLFVPEINPVFAFNVMPDGNVFAEINTPYPAAEEADAVTLLMGAYSYEEITKLDVGVNHVTTSVLIVKLNCLSTVCDCASKALAVNVYVVLLPSTGAVPVITPELDSVEPVGKEPDNNEYVRGASPVATIG